MKDFKVMSTQWLKIVEYIGLTIISLSTLIAFGFEISSMVGAARVTLADLLLMFIYLEVLAMIAIYLESGKLPVRMPLYIAIVALARYLILDMKNLETMRILGIGGAILLMAITVLVIRYGHCKFSYDEKS
ncbi:MAG: phosphate-starvation-inducible PsiE family protein [Gammaproteobacteria bacterium]|nr:phosphate-starvation-inducible PsiE family protein [Gammaproteobacteria bacterium]